MQNKLLSNFNGFDSIKGIKQIIQDLVCFVAMLQDVQNNWKQKSTWKNKS